MNGTGWKKRVKDLLGWNDSHLTNNLQKLPKKQKLLLLLLFGLLLLVLALPQEKRVSNEQKDEADMLQQEEQQTAKAHAALESYASGLETKMEQLLSGVDGVGEVSVMITVQSSGEKVVEKDTKEATSEVSEEERTQTERTTSEETVYEDGTQTGQTPYVISERLPEVEGVVVIAQGGADPVTAQEITEAVQALLDVQPHKIKVMKRK